MRLRAPGDIIHIQTGTPSLHVSPFINIYFWCIRHFNNSVKPVETGVRLYKGYTCLWGYTCSLYGDTLIYGDTPTYIYMEIHLYMGIHIYIWLHLYTRIHLHIWGCTYIRGCTYIWGYMYTYIWGRTYILATRLHGDTLLTLIVPFLILRLSRNEIWNKC